MDEQEKSGKESVKGFIDDVHAEFNKISWPTWKELKGSTRVVIVFILLMGACVCLFDYVLFGLVRLIMER